MSPVIECENLIKRYGETVALDGFSLKVEPGRVVGLLGPAGSGKTTFMKLAMGMLTLDGGVILIDGKAPGVETKRVTAFLPDGEAFEDRASARDLLRLYRDFYSDFDAQKAISLLSDLGIGVKDKIKDMSKGDVQKLRLALTMSRRAKLYLLDEPISGVDPATRDYILDAIISNKDPESAIVISTNNASEVEKVLQDAAFIKNGRIILFEDAEMLRNEKGRSVEEAFREEFK